MASENESGERTEEATPQRREEFRRRGQVAHTRELATVFALLSALFMIWVFGKFFLSQIHDVFITSFKDHILLAARQGEWISASLFVGGKLVLILGPMLLIFWLFSIISTLVQIGFLYNDEALKINFNHIDPIQGFKRILSLKNIVEGIKATFKLLLITWVTWFILKKEVSLLPHLVEFSVQQMFLYLGQIIFKLISALGFIMLFLSGFDYLFQRWSLEKEMMMSKQEIKEEVKSREGDPLIRARIKRIQREMSSRRMMEKVPKADVIITNPTHIAVALKYDGNMVSPQLLAKGADLIAEKIRAIAKEHGIPIVENKPLARTIYKTIKVGQQIPRELYTAVAEVLAYVYRLKRKIH